MSVPISRLWQMMVPSCQHKSEHELLLDLAAKSRNTVSADLPDYIMEKDIVRAALRVAKEVDATDEEWQTFMKMLKERKR